LSKTGLIRAWKDEEYRLSLSEAERAQLPQNPAGALELSDADLDQVAGCNGGLRCQFWSLVFCGVTFACVHTVVVA
jgi:mersacidin/lichenicidin family type 2 lantibiotic